jgi:hypothetical protein
VGRHARPVAHERARNPGAGHTSPASSRRRPCPDTTLLQRDFSAIEKPVLLTGVKLNCYEDSKELDYWLMMPLERA